MKEKKRENNTDARESIFHFIIGNPDQNQVVTFNFKLIHRITLHLTDRNDQA